ncbi:hypothetical protein GCM10029963_65690 [Micromonospora andamanensis]|nr:hypothetical protein Vwe01_08460 [Micromonospora andamanensis]
MSRSTRTKPAAIRPTPTIPNTTLCQAPLSRSSSTDCLPTSLRPADAGTVIETIAAPGNARLPGGGPVADAPAWSSGYSDR